MKRGVRIRREKLADFARRYKSAIAALLEAEREDNPDSKIRRVMWQPVVSAARQEFRYAVTTSQIDIARTLRAAYRACYEQKEAVWRTR